MHNLAQTLAVSTVVGVILVGLYTLFLIPINRKKARTRSSSQDLDYKFFEDALLLLDDDAHQHLSPLSKEKLRKQLLKDVKDRIRVYEAQSELADLEKRPTNSIVAHSIPKEI
jgi:hypothetical protein